MMVVGEPSKDKKRKHVNSVFDIWDYDKIAEGIKDELSMEAEMVNGEFYEFIGDGW